MNFVLFKSPLALVNQKINQYSNSVYITIKQTLSKVLRPFRRHPLYIGHGFDHKHIPCWAWEMEMTEDHGMMMMMMITIEWKLIAQ